MTDRPQSAFFFDLSPPRYFSIVSGRPFLGDLARGLIAAFEDELPQAEIYLPTRRAARALGDAILDARASAGARAALLPRMRAIGDIDEDELAAFAGDAEDELALAPAISGAARLLALARLVAAKEKAFAGQENWPAALAAARELGKLLDSLYAEEIDPARLGDIDVGDRAEHWRKSAEFLQIVTKAWPAYLAEQGLSDPAWRRAQLITAKAKRIQTEPPAHPVLIAGTTASAPAVARLVAAIAAAPRGAAILPGLDRELDPKGYDSIEDAHPQFGLKRLLDRLGLNRDAITVLRGAEPPAAARLRTAFVSEAMRPSATTARWHTYAERADRNAIAEAMSGINLIETPSAQDEAEAIALIMREAAESPGRTVALVSPDRLLARRVGVRLESFGIRVDDSAGRPFAKTVPGTFLDLVIGAIAEDFAPAALMPLLKHPLTRLGLDAFTVRKSARALEIAAFRTAYLGRGLDGISAALERAAMGQADGERRDAAVRRLWQDDWQGARDLVARVEKAFAPLVAAFESRQREPLSQLARAHIETAEAMAALPMSADPGIAGSDPDLSASSPLWQGEAGRSASLFFTGLLDTQMPAVEIAARDYPDLYRGLIAGENVRPRVPVHPRLAIWGPFEARLQQPDVLILGSLNDGTWPESSDPGPWLNRPMRLALGLPSPEEKIGLAAHDVAMLLGAETVFVTRAEKMDGVPTVPSRWLLRIKALLDGLGLADVLGPQQPWQAWAMHRDAAGARRAIKPPAPRPPVADRPRRLSVSGVETWIANPYAIFARHVLKLEPLPRLGEPPDASLRGGIVHEALRRFTASYPERLPPDPAAALLRIARDVLQDYTGNPRIAAFWLTRLERFAHWFAASEAVRRQGFDRIASEVKGELVLDAPAGPFKLTARADRIDVSHTGLRITDYKTGAIPSNDRVVNGSAPQLPLEAAIAAVAGFAGVPQAAVTELRYIRASGGEPPGEEVTIRLKDGNVDSLSREQLDRFASLIARYDDPATPYSALRRSRFTYDYDSYAHLARIGEWSADADGAEE